MGQPWGRSQVVVHCSQAPGVGLDLSAPWQHRASGPRGRPVENLGRKQLCLLEWREGSNSQALGGARCGATPDLCLPAQPCLRVMLHRGPPGAVLPRLCLRPVLHARF